MPKLFPSAKINLRLRITGRRPDGYHLLDMVMVRLELCDEIDFEMTTPGVSIDSDSPDFPRDETNTLWKLAEQVRQESGRQFGVRIFVKKRIPIAAGLGGGSSDAASLLLGLNRELKLGWSGEKMIQVGLKIGADLPFFLAEGAQRVTGIGEILEPMSVPSLPVVLINPGFPVSTKEVYRWFDTANPLPSETVDFTSYRRVLPAGSPLSCVTNGLKGQTGRHPPEQGRKSTEVAGLTGIKADAIPPLLENDLERVVFSHYPVLAKVKGQLRKAGALGALMSGSGGTVFGLFDSTASRDRGFDLIASKKDPKWWLWKGASL